MHEDATLKGSFMSNAKEIRDKVDAVAEWYKTREDFDSVLIHYGWLKMKSRAYPGTALELGSADGLMTERLLKHFKRVVVVEGAEKNVQWVKKNFPEVEVHHCLFEEFTTTEKFDNIIAARVLEHLDDPVGVLSKIRKFLSPGGRLHVVVPNADSFNRKLGLAMGMIKSLDELSERDLKCEHRRVYRKDLLMTHLREAGFDVQELTGTFLKPLSNALMMNWDPKIIEGLNALSDELPLYCTELYAVCTARE